MRRIVENAGACTPTRIAIARDRGEASLTDWVPAGAQLFRCRSRLLRPASSVGRVAFEVLSSVSAVSFCLHIACFGVCFFSGYLINGPQIGKEGQSPDSSNKRKLLPLAESSFSTLEAFENCSGGNSRLSCLFGVGGGHFFIKNSWGNSRPSHCVLNRIEKATPRDLTNARLC